MDKETLIKIAEELHHGAFDANADYLILQQYRKNQREYAEEMKMSPAFYQTIHGALMKACLWRSPNCMIAQMALCPLAPSLPNARKIKTYFRRTEKQ